MVCCAVKGDDSPTWREPGTGEHMSVMPPHNRATRLRIHARRQEYLHTIQDFLWWLKKIGCPGAMEALAVMQMDVNFAMKVKSAALHEHMRRTAALEKAAGSED